MAQYTMKEKIRKLEKRIEEEEAEKKQLKEKLDEARDELEEEKKKTEEERRRREEEVGEKLREISEMEEKLGVEENEKMKLKKELRMEEDERRRYEKRAAEYQRQADDEKTRNEGLSSELKMQEEEMKKTRESNEHLRDFQKRCVDILTGELVDDDALIDFTILVSDRFQMHVAVSLGVPWLVEHVKMNSNLLKTRNERGWTPFTLATARGDTRIMESLWQSKKDLQKDFPPLHVAAANRQYEAAKFLKERVDNSDNYKEQMANQVARLVGDKPLAKKIEPLWFCVCTKVPKHCDLSIEEIDDLMLILRRSTSVNTGSGNKKRPITSTRSPVPPSPPSVKSYGSTSLTHVPLLTRDGEPTDLQVETWLPTGIPNLGNTCYLNSVVQCLYHTSLLATRLRELEKDKTQGKVVKATVKVMVALHRRKNPREDVKLLKRVSGQRDSVYDDFEQKEAHDFLSNMLEWLHEEMALRQEKEEAKDTEAVSFISKIFHGTHLSTITCEEEEPPTGVCTNHETFSNLSLTVTGPTTLQEALEQYYNPQGLEWECNRCRRVHRCQHKVSLTKPPIVLVLHLNRVSDPASSREKVKVSYRADLGVGLNTGASRTYSLFAVCCHDGGMSGGHYTAYCRSGEQWYYFNDRIVKRVDLEGILDKPSAHILFYEAEETAL